MRLTQIIITRILDALHIFSILHYVTNVTLRYIRYIFFSLVTATLD